MFRLNPFVSDIPDRYAVDIGGIKVLVAGAVKKGGSGCYCPENAMIRALVSHLLVERDAALVLDMEAGIEHLSRGTIRGVDRLLVVLEPSRRSVETAERIYRLAADVGLTSIACIGNKIRSGDDRGFLERALPDARFAGFVDYDDSLRVADMSGDTVVGVSASAERSIRAVSAGLAADLAAAPETEQENEGNE
jgi:CO dehydrogenase maturation factor